MFEAPSDHTIEKIDINVEYVMGDCDNPKIKKNPNKKKESRTIMEKRKHTA